MSKKINKILVELKKAIMEENEGAMGDMLCGELSRLLKPKTSWTDDLPKISAEDIIDGIDGEGFSKIIGSDNKKPISKKSKKNNSKDKLKVGDVSTIVRETNREINSCQDENCCCQNNCKNGPIKVKNIDKK